MIDGPGYHYITYCVLTCSKDIFLRLLIMEVKVKLFITLMMQLDRICIDYLISLTPAEFCDISAEVCTVRQNTAGTFVVVF